jgi:hypothetical protein
MRQDQAILNQTVRLVEKTSNRCGILRSVEIFSAVSHTHAILSNGGTPLLSLSLETSHPRDSSQDFSWQYQLFPGTGEQMMSYCIAKRTEFFKT